MNKSVIIHAKAGHIPDKEYVQKVLKEFPSYYGIILQDQEDGKPILDTVSDDKAITIEYAMGLFENMKDQPCWFVFGNVSQDFDKLTDPQPYLFQQSGDGGDENAQTILGMIFEGDFAEYSKPGKGHVDEYNLFDEYIYPLLQEKFDAATSLEDFFNRLKTSQFQQTILHTMAHRGVAVFVPDTGEALVISRNELGKEYEWGWTSNSLGWGGAQAQGNVLQKAAGAVKSRLQRAVGGSGIVAPPTETSSAALMKKTQVKPPEQLMGNARNTWIRLFMGLSKEAELPKNYMSKDFFVEVTDVLLPYAQRPVTTRDQVRSMEEEIRHKHFPTGSAPASDPIKPTPNADKPTLAGPSEYLPVMSAETKEAAVNMVLDWATRPKDKSPSPLDIQKMESKWVPFSQQCGIKPSNYAWWTAHDVKKLGKEQYEALALSWLEIRKIALEKGGLTELPEQVQVQPDKDKPALPAPASAPASTGTATPKKSRLDRALKKAG